MEVTAHVGDAGHSTPRMWLIFDLGVKRPSDLDLRPCCL